MADFEKQLIEEIERNEIWLARFETPEASPALVTRIKGAVRQELARQSARRRILDLRPWQSVFAAAAMLAICVGIAWYSSSYSPRTVGPLADAPVAENVPEEVDALFSTFADSDSDLTELDDLAYDEAWSLDGVSLYSAWDEAFTDDSGQSGGGGEGDSTSMRTGGQKLAEEIS